MTGPGKMKNISIVIPVYRGEASIGPLVDCLFQELGPTLGQVVLVNDDSPDTSNIICKAICHRHGPKVVYLRLGRNFGEHNAVMAGLTRATGDYVVIMDDDFQNPPSEVTKLVKHAQKHCCDVVYSYYDSKKHRFWRNAGSLFNNMIATWLLKKPADLYLSSFKCVNRWLVGEILKYQGPYPYIDGLILRSTSSIGKVKVEHSTRREGQSSYTLRKLISLWLRVFLNFSVVPLRASTILGLGLSGLGILMGLEVVWEKYYAPGTPVGWASLIVTILVFSGVQLVMLGLVGEYLGRLFLTVNGTPQYTIREELNESQP